MSAPSWSCAVCGCDSESAKAWRRRNRRGPLPRTAVVCGRPFCQREYHAVYLARFWARAYKRTGLKPVPKDPRGASRCSICGIGRAEAVAARRARGLPALPRRQARTCSPECAAKWLALYRAGPQRPATFGESR